MKPRLFIAVTAAVLLSISCSGDSSDDGTPSPTTREELPGFLVFSSNVAGDFDIYSMPANGGETTNLTKSPGDDVEPAVSPDGKRLAFQSTRDGTRNIFLMDLPGGTAEVLAAGAAVEGGLRWAPNSQEFAYYSFKADQLGFMWLADISKKNDYPLLEAIHPSGPEVDCAGGFPGDWLSDDTILFRGGNGEDHSLQICAVDKDRSNLRIIFGQPNSSAYNPDLSPGGELIAMSFQPEGASSADIYVMAVEGRNLRQITSLDGNELNPTWSPDGEWIAFASNEDGDYELYAVRSDGTDLRKLTDNSYDDQEPFWIPVSPD